MNRIETLETLIEIQELINFAQKQINWRVKDLENLYLLPEIAKSYKKQIESKEKAIERLEQRFNKLLLTLNK